jgi:hypothetical protein
MAASLKSFFLDCSSVAASNQELPPEWNTVLTRGPSEAGKHVADLLELAADSTIRERLRRSSEIGVFAPKRKRDARNRRTWRLGLLERLEPLIFYMPSVEYMYDDEEECPPEYIRLVRHMGALRFGVSSGRLLWPSQITAVSRQIRDTLDSGHAVTAFYDHETGDYDCWTQSADREYYTFDHESRELSKLGLGRFGSWFELRFATERSEGV